MYKDNGLLGKKEEEEDEERKKSEQKERLFRIEAVKQKKSRKK